MEKTKEKKNSTSKKIPDIRPGDKIKIYQKIKEAQKKGKKEDFKERTQIFEGLVLARKHGKEKGATITVRKVISGVGVEKIFPLNLPTIEKIKIIKRSKVRRAKLYYLRKARGKRARLKRKEFKEAVVTNPTHSVVENKKAEVKEEPEKTEKAETDKNIEKKENPQAETKEKTDA